jgi:hypothetical protein
MRATKNCKKCIVVAVNIVAVVRHSEFFVDVVVVTGRSSHLRKRRGASSLRLNGRHALAP